MGEGAKSGKLPAIGKFGQGLKSIFHFCEAFFYVASASATGLVRRSEFINPWANTSLHPEWRRDLSEDDVSLIVQYMSPLIRPGREWFSLWIPLRSRRQLRRTNPLIAEYPGEELLRPGSRELGPEPAESLFTSDFDQRLAGLMPMMKNLVRVSFWELSRAAASECFCGVHRDEGSTVTQVGERSAPYSARLEGSICVERRIVNDSARRSSVVVEYRGVDRWLANPGVVELQRSSAWPQHAWTDPKTGREIHEGEKAMPHVAAYRRRSKLRKKRRLRLCLRYSYRSTMRQAHPSRATGRRTFNSCCTGISSSTRSTQYPLWS